MTHYPLEKQCMIHIACIVLNNFIMHATNDELFVDASNEDLNFPLTKEEIDSWRRLK